MQQYGLNNGKPFIYDILSLIFTRSLLKTDEWSIIAGNTKWDNNGMVSQVENKKVGGTNADLIEDHMLGQFCFDYSRTKIIKRI